MLETFTLLVGAIIAYRIRDVPSLFNESRVVGMSLYAILFVLIITIPVLLTNEGSPDVFYAILRY